MASHRDENDRAVDAAGTPSDHAGLWEEAEAAAERGAADERASFTEDPPRPDADDAEISAAGTSTPKTMPASGSSPAGTEAPTVHDPMPAVSASRRLSASAVSGRARVPATSDDPPVERMVWTPEDAGRFLAEAIRTAQRPLEQALAAKSARRWWALLLLVAFLVPAGFAAVNWWQYHATSELRLAEAIQERNDARLLEHARIEQALDARADAERLRVERDAARDSGKETRDRLAAVAARQDGASKELRALERTLAETKEALDTAARERDALRQTAEDARRWQRERELLRAQIAGMVQEQEALRRQLAATRAMLADATLDAAAVPPPPADGDALKESRPLPKTDAEIKTLDERAENQVENLKTQTERILKQIEKANEAMEGVDALSLDGKVLPTDPATDPEARPDAAAGSVHGKLDHPANKPRTRVIPKAYKPLVEISAATVNEEAAPTTTAAKDDSDGTE